MDKLKVRYKYNINIVNLKLNKLLNNNFNWKKQLLKYRKIIFFLILIFYIIYYILILN